MDKNCNLIGAIYNTNQNDAQNSQLPKSAYFGVSRTFTVYYLQHCSISCLRISNINCDETTSQFRRCLHLHTYIDFVGVPWSTFKIQNITILPMTHVQSWLVIHREIY